MGAPDVQGPEYVSIWKVILVGLDTASKTVGLYRGCGSIPPPSAIMSINNYMTTYRIIEDCSPYYIRYTFDGIENLTNLCKTYILPKKGEFGFRHLRLERPLVDNVLDLVPASKQMPLQKDRVSLFMTEPGFYYSAHKDGMDHRFSLNFTVTVLDDKCVTSWYSDEDLKTYKISTDIIPSANNLYVPGASREVLEWDKSKHTPLKSMVAKPNEAILFNTELFHDWDNRTSTNRRVVLTLRHQNPGAVYFEDARKILFGY